LRQRADLWSLIFTRVARTTQPLFAARYTVLYSVPHGHILPLVWTTSQNRQHFLRTKSYHDWSMLRTLGVNVLPDLRTPTC